MPVFRRRMVRFLRGGGGGRSSSRVLVIVSLKVLLGQALGNLLVGGMRTGEGWRRCGKHLLALTLAMRLLRLRPRNLALRLRRRDLREHVHHLRLHWLRLRLGFVLGLLLLLRLFLLFQSSLPFRFFLLPFLSFFLSLDQVGSLKGFSCHLDPLLLLALLALFLLMDPHFLRLPCFLGLSLFSISLVDHELVYDVLQALGCDCSSQLTLHEALFYQGVEGLFHVLLARFEVLLFLRADRLPQGGFLGLNILLERQERGKHRGKRGKTELLQKGV
mmetsp:Transcript_25925/g.53955  ORF Transcript_25925/g.53955 Transcript_25925/m.53955 type:complete len:274 (+) Transcript_25925:510-1331(+)